MLCSAPMRGVLVTSLLITFAGMAAAADDIQTVNSWADYRAKGKALGKTDAEIDARVSDLLRSLTTMDRSAGDDRIGVAAPPFQFEEWLNSKPLDIRDLRGSVVLLRWWTDTCPLCATTSPTLRKLHDEYSGKGLKVIGVFHPKAGRDNPLDVERVRRAVETRQLTFAVPIDWEWRTLKAWWLETGSKKKRPATSVTFLLDKNGVIRYVHPGMEYHDGAVSPEHSVCQNDLAAIRAAVDRLLQQ